MRLLLLNDYEILLAHIPLYLYPFLYTTRKTRPFEYFRRHWCSGEDGKWTIKNKLSSSKLLVAYLHTVIQLQNYCGSYVHSFWIACSSPEGSCQSPFATNYGRRVATTR
ncbi:uncharacterized protein LOC125224257 isoform X2 [Salvia hispanica]|uniref:uncharacterized protein LOC125224257 isoform X2 n=1 Tax=Salvia hispanica TaxID=49212 RepID=UPI00200928A5|nr:uncharacterized protein LOC125224257 isoform X2 [Salvia hispanica]